MSSTISYIATCWNQVRDIDASRCATVGSFTFRFGVLCAGFVHSAFAFNHESLVGRSNVNSLEVPPGALISFVQKGLQYCEIEAHVNEVSKLRRFNSFLQPVGYRMVQKQYAISRFL